MHLLNILYTKLLMHRIKEAKKLKLSPNILKLPN